MGWKYRLDFRCHGPLPTASFLSGVHHPGGATGLNVFFDLEYRTNPLSSFAAAAHGIIRLSKHHETRWQLLDRLLKEHPLGDVTFLRADEVRLEYRLGRDTEVALSGVEFESTDVRSLRVHVGSVQRVTELINRLTAGMRLDLKAFEYWWYDEHLPDGLPFNLGRWVDKHLNHPLGH